MTLLEHNTAMLDRIHHLGAIGPGCAQVLEQGKRRHLSAGTSAHGQRFVNLAKSTLERRRQSPLPFLVRGQASSILLTYDVTFTQQQDTLIIQAGWPLPWIKYHVKGNKRLPRRDPTGFREEDLAEVGRRLKDWVMKGYK